MPSTIRTIGPLHLEDLEPHRYEDLIRQLSYDFRPWLAIEPTGRGGSDDGYDARAWERTDIPPDEIDEDNEVHAPAARLWLIQCKREKSIPPKKLAVYLDALPQNKDEPIYGIIFAAACEFSKAARDLFRTKTRELGFSEAYLWGKADVEDQLFQPKNDHLLFAYCGFSLQMRKRSLKTEVRSTLSTKRKAIKLLENYRPILIRDASEDRYPFLDPDTTLDRKQRGRWRVFDMGLCKYDGIHVRWKRECAFIDKDGVHWDRAEKMDDGVPNPHFNRWADKTLMSAREGAREEALTIWNTFEEEEKAWYEIMLVLPYENIIAFDDEGDDYFDHGPHIYTTPWLSQSSPFREYCPWELRTIGSAYVARSCEMEDANRVAKFPRHKS